MTKKFKPIPSRRAVIQRSAALTFGASLPSFQSLAETQSWNELSIPAAYPYARLRDGAPEGIIAEPVVAALRDIGKDIRFRQRPIPSIYTAVENAEVAGGVVLTDIGDRKDRAHYIKPIVTEYSILITRSDKPNLIRKRSDLNGLKIGGRTGFFYSSLDKRHMSRLQARQTDAESIRDLLLGRIDAAIIGGIKVLHELRAEGVFKYIHNTGFAVGRVGLGAAFSFDHVSVEDIQQINRTVETIKESTIWSSILAKHGCQSLIRDYEVL